MAEVGKHFERLAVAVAGGQSVRAAALELEIAERSAYRESCKPEFRQRVSEIRTELVTQALGSLAETTTAAASRLSRLVQSDDEAIALRACTVVLDRFSKLNDSIDIRERLEQLEKTLAAKEAVA